jgi:hypothetical protein
VTGHYMVVLRQMGLITLYCAIRSGPGRWNLSELIQSPFCMVGLLCHSEFSLILEGMLWENSFTNMGGKVVGWCLTI